ncbi:MAG: BCCT family transporter, partial [Candidatus Adiutrix sp.]|nr:BCCT family transporter [Candidatus Adiutrix sp.]
MSAKDDSYAKGTGQIDWTIFLPAFLIIVAITIPLASNPTLGKDMVNASFAFVTDKFGWLAMLTAAVSVGFLLWLCLSPYGRIVLGKPGEKPEFTTF